MGMRTTSVRRGRTALRLAVSAAVVLAAQALGLVPAAADAPVLSQRIDSGVYQANGPVDAVLTIGSTTYLGGDFTSMRPAGSDAGTGETPRSHLAAVDNVTGELLAWNPGANGSVHALAASPDGSTVYVGGSFGVLGGAVHKRLGAVTASGSGAALSGFAPDADGKVYALAATASTVYAGGAFATIDGVARSRAAAVDAADGSLVAAWAPVMNGSVRSIALSPDGSWVYVAGEFTSVNGLTRERFITRLSATAAAISPLTSHAGYPIWSVVVTADSIFVGGNGAGGHASELSTSGVQRWKLQTDGGVQTVYFLDGVLYVGGHFDNVCTGDTDGPTTGFRCPAGTVGALRHKLVAVVPDSSTSLGYDVASWDPGANSALGVFAMSSDGSSLQVGGEFTTIGLGTAKQQAYAELSPNEAPVPSFTSACTGLTCSLNARASADSGGPVAAYAWDFGDGTAATGSTATHTWARNGTPSVTLTVTDNEGLQSSLTQTVSVASSLPTARFTVTCPDLTCTLDAGGSSDPDGTVADFAWSFSDGGTASGASATHHFTASGPGSYDVTLTVTDDTGGSATSTQTVVVSPPQTSPISFVDGSAASANKFAQTFTVKVPAVQAGDLLLLALTNNNIATPATPAGWQAVGTRLLSADGTNGSSTVWQRVAQLGDAGTNVTVTLSGSARAALTLVAYRGTSQTTPVAGVSAAETVNRASHATPSVNSVPGGAWVVSYWADRSSTTTSWTAPDGESTRATSIGAAGTTAHIDALVSDSGGQVPAGFRSGRTATADAATGRAAMWTLVLAPPTP